MSVGRRRPEDSIQRTVCKHLRMRGSPGLVWWHTPNGVKRRPIEAAIMKSFGVRAGVSDFIAVHDGKPFALELKADDGRALSLLRLSACLRSSVGSGVRAADEDGDLPEQFDVR